MSQKLPYEQILKTVQAINQSHRELSVVPPVPVPSLECIRAPLHAKKVPDAFISPDCCRLGIFVACVVLQASSLAGSVNSSIFRACVVNRLTAVPLSIDAVQAVSTAGVVVATVRVDVVYHYARFVQNQAFFH